jgi:hypothetical protein
MGVRAWATAYLAGAGAILGVVVSTVFATNSDPQELKGAKLVWGTALGTIALVTFMLAAYDRVEQAAADRERRELESRIEALTAEVRTLNERLRERPERRRWWRWGKHD